MQKDVGAQSCEKIYIEEDKQKYIPKYPEAVPFTSMFRFADKLDIIMMTVGTVGALCLGASTPLFVMFWGDFTNTLSESSDNIVDESKVVLIKLVIVGIVAWISGWAMIAGYLISGQRQAVACRKAYFRSLLGQEIGWFDTINQSELSSNFSSDTLIYQGAIGEKVALMLQVLGTFIGGFIVAFISGWLMSLVCLAGMPVIALAGWLYIRSLQQKSKELQSIYSSAGGMAEQALYSIKTVKQMNGEIHEEQQYQNKLEEVGDNNIKFGVKISLAYAFMSASIFLLYSVGYWFGSNCVEGVNGCQISKSGKKYSTGDVVTVFFAVLVSCHNLSQLSPALKKIGEGQQAAARIFSILDRTSKVRNCENPIIPDSFKGQITFENVTFAYPKDPSRLILDNLSIKFDINNTALVGDSGCGKSTIIQLIMRFYDPDVGTVYLDGVDLRSLDLAWLRTQIGYVGQQPVLFATTIKQNLKYGYKDATDEDLQDALTKAEAYDFVYNQLENKLNTFVGAGGGQISGGQKQRIAIARALLKKPKILLLDEATSALDRRNQLQIQNTLNKISMGLTTITVAHRVQSIMSADLIYVINKGKIQESGKFNELKRFRDFKQTTQENEKTAEKVQEEPLKQITAETKLKKKHSQKAIKSQKQVKEEEKKELIEKYGKGTYGRIFGYMKKHRLSFGIGVIITLVLGGIYPVFSIYLGTILNSLFDLKSSNLTIKNNGRDAANSSSLAFLLLAIGTFIFTFIRDLLTYVVGNQITENIRRQAFQKMLKMPVEWFDDPKNNCGALSTRLGTDCETINGMATTYIYILIQCIGTLITGVVVALVFEWRTALTAIALMPFVVMAGAVRAAFRNGLSQKSDQAYNNSAQTVMESLTNIRTVASFGVENTIAVKYQNFLEEPMNMLMRNSIISGVFFGLSQLSIFVVFGLLFFIGSVYMRDVGVQLLDVFVAIYAIFFSGITIGNNSHFLPDITQAKLAAAHIFTILDSEDEEQIQIREKSQMLKEGIAGQISLEDVSFKYSNRQQYVFQNMNISIKPGQKVAFVGASGCGKSTIMQLLQRFYLPESGKITINKIDIKDFDIHYLRSCLGVVSQEPVLFNSSFRDNIKYNKYDATEEQIRKAAEKSQALSFIEGTEQLAEQVKDQKRGFDRNVGIKGSHISGGQKQRVAIARAILRQPKILLLDEATSALDSVNQKIVQQSLDNIMRDKTTISIAHRIETIKNSDVINVFERGKIVESGTYTELIQKKGYFYNLEQGTQFV